MSDATPVGRHRTDNRRRWLTILGAVVLVAALVYGLYWLLYARYFEVTDDAYVGGDVVSITSREPATVLALHADNTQAVRRGQLLVELDPIKAQVAMQAAEADLARTVRAVRAQFLQGRRRLAPRFPARRWRWRRRRTITAAGRAPAQSVSGEELAHARDAVTAAQANARVAQERLAAGVGHRAGTDVAHNPDVLAADRAAAPGGDHARPHASYRAGRRRGRAAHRAARPAGRAGTPLMAVVPLDDVWIDANFKEGQLAHAHRPAGDGDRRHLWRQA
jgi:membrane fusion protein (multidrug efflux system)